MYSTLEQLTKHPVFFILQKFQRFLEDQVMKRKLVII